MSLLLLLTTGKSLVGVSDAESRYRVTSQRLLPQFGPARNAFSSKAPAEPARTAVPPIEDHSENGASGAKPSLPGAGGQPETLLQEGAERRVALAKFDPRHLAGALWRGMIILLSEWRAKLCGLLKRSGRKTAKPAVPRFLKPPVQGELRLDRIKVMRNDLSDADLEVLPAKAPAPTARVPASPAAVEEAEGAKHAWRQVANRMLGAGKR